MAALRSAQLGQPPEITAAYAATVRSLIAVITVLNEQVKVLESEVEAVFGRHLGEFGNDPDRYASAKAQELRRHLPGHPRLREEENCRSGSSVTTGSSTRS